MKFSVDRAHSPFHEAIFVHSLGLSLHASALRTQFPERSPVKLSGALNASLLRFPSMSVPGVYHSFYNLEKGDVQMNQAKYL